MAGSRFIAAGVAIAVVGLAACVGPDGSDGAAATTLAPIAPISAITAPPERNSPFCVGMSELYQQLEDSSGDDEVATIIAAYTELLPTVPVEIAVDFRQVITDLEAGADVISLDADPDSTLTTSPPSTVSAETAPPSTAEYFEEGYDPDDTAAGRVNAYVQFACTGGQNNPGPPPTQPEQAIPTIER